MMKKQALSVREVANRLGVSERLVRSAIESGELWAVRLGRRVLVPADALDEFLSGRLKPMVAHRLEGGGEL